ncbi:MAG TPA: prepilin-type N-terminal cleavage/methylation domain-containing protein [Phycisphaerae bacterium]|nr:prepilin-type N-terminal cleavage/methylation domain-containing protein [Phycisphaerae bacterium]
MRRKNGFTLIELLVVIAILSLLVSLLLPSLSKAKELAKEVQCAVLLRNFGTANHLFAQDHEERFLPVRTDRDWPKNPTSDNINWYRNDDFRALLHATRISWDARYRWDPKFLCPMSGRGPSLIQPDGTVSPEKYYGYNITGVGAQDEFNERMNAGVRITDVYAMGEKLMFADGLYDRLDRRASCNYKDEFSGSNGIYTGTASTYIAAYRHRGGLNIVYFDGHAGWRSREETDTSYRDVTGLWNFIK